jgi:hypothetical protein
VRSAQEARAVVAAAKYPPLGGRGASGALPQLHYRNFPAAEANAALDAATMVIVQFESWEAVDKAEEIVAVEGVDMVLIGVNDLLAGLLLGRWRHRVLEIEDQGIGADTGCLCEFVLAISRHKQKGAKSHAGRLIIRPMRRQYAISSLC